MRLFRRSQREFEEEIRTHLEIETDQLIAEGHAPEEARQLARKRFGNVGMAQERYYDASPLAWLHDAVTDARYALRMMRKRPGFGVSVILISSLGLVACVTTFSLVSGILLKPFPFAKQDRVFRVEMRGQGIETAALPVAVYDSLARAPEVAAIGASAPRAVVLGFDGELVRAPSTMATASIFSVYGIRPALGRFFTEGERAVAVLDHDEWRTRFGSDTAVLGRVLTVNGSPWRIIGVLPPRFRDSPRARSVLWYPMEIDRARPGADVNAVVRVADSVPIASAASSIRRYRGRVEDFGTGDSVMATVGLRPIGDRINGWVREPLRILLGAVLLVLALVAANVSTLFLAQVASRRGELGIRRALGAGRGRQLRQLMVESLTLTSIGGALGLMASVGTIGYVRSIGVLVLPRIDEVAVDWRVGLFALGTVVLTGLAGGVAQAVGTRHTAGIAATSRVTSATTSAGLVIVQVALSVVLLVGAGLLVKGFLKVAPYQPGFETANRATLQVTFLGERGQGTNAAVERVRASLAGVPGVSDVAVGTWLPLTGMAAIIDVEPPGVRDKRVAAYEYVVGPNYFDVMRMTVRTGRRFSAGDRAGSEPVAIVGETAAIKWFGRANPIGEKLTVGRGKDRHAVTVVGVVNDTRLIGQDTRLRPQLYLPAAQDSLATVTFVVATALPPHHVIPSLRRAVAGVAPQSVINEASDIATITGQSVQSARFFSVGMAMFAAAAVALTGLGVFGLFSFTVAERRKEIGIRLALGAGTARIGRAIIGRAAAVAVTGIVAGLAAAYGLTRYMESLLTEVTARDPSAFSVAPLVALLCAMVAAAVPTLQAIRIDPNETMRA